MAEVSTAVDTGVLVGRRRSIWTADEDLPDYANFVSIAKGSVGECNDEEYAVPC